jgi:hypothetical protein
MNALLTYLNKLGVKSYQDLNEEEKNTYKEFETALSGRKLTDEDVSNFLDQELQVAIGRLTEVDLPKETEIFRKMEVKMIKKIQNFLNSPKLEKELLEKTLLSN